MWLDTLDSIEVDAHSAYPCTVAHGVLFLIQKCCAHPPFVFAMQIQKHQSHMAI
jgi:hypothetical protein